jgi:hypothetical protein
LGIGKGNKPSILRHKTQLPFPKSLQKVDKLLASLYPNIIFVDSYK